MAFNSWMEKVKITNDEVSQLKREFRCYNTYVYRCARYQTELAALKTELEHLHSPVLDKPVIRTENTNHDRYYEIIDEIKPQIEAKIAENLEKMKDIVLKMDLVDDEDRVILEDIFINKLTMKKASKKYHYAPTGMEYKLDSILAKIVRKLGY